MTVKFRLALLILTFAIMAFPLSAITPEVVMAKAVSGIKSAQGISGNFTISGEGGSTSGTFRLGGRKFYMDNSASGSIWFDGTTQWTLNKRNKEVTIDKPNADELKEINPLLYLSDYTASSKIFFSKTRKEKGKYLVVLNPKNKNSAWKAVEIMINSNNYTPERIIVRNAEDAITTIRLSGLNYNKRFMNSDFVFPKDKYPEYELIDLR